MPKTSLNFPDGAVLCIGTVSCDDQIHKAVFISFTGGGAAEPAMELALPPKSVDLIIRQLQEYANQARFVNGQDMLEYPEPYLIKQHKASPRIPKSKPKREKKGQQVVPPNGP